MPVWDTSSRRGWCVCMGRLTTAPCAPHQTMYTIKNSQVSVPCNTLIQVLALLNERYAPLDLVQYRATDPLRIEANDGRQWPVEFQPGSYLAYPLLHDGQHPLQWVDRLLIEVRLHVICPLGTVLRPQHMPRSVWNGLQTLLELTKGYGNMFTFEQRNATWSVDGVAVNSLFSAYTRKFQTYFGYGPCGPERETMQTASHEWYVAQALLRGEDIDQSTLDEYATIDWVRACSHREVDWIAHLLQRTHLRGMFSSGKHLNFALSNEGKPDCSYKEITVENVGYLAQLLNSLPSSAGWTEMDDLFYEKGILTVRDLPETDLPSLADGVPVDKLAEAVHVELIKNVRKAQADQLEERIKQGMSKREIEFTRRRIACVEREFSYSYPNKVATAVTERNIHFLIEILDSSINVSTQRAIKRVTGIEIERKPSRERIREIFRLVGHGDDAQYQQARAAYDAQVVTAAAAKQARVAIKEREQSRERLTAAMKTELLKFDGKVMTKAAFIEWAIAQGHNRVTTEKRGAVPRYYLVNEKGSGYQLKTKDGMLDYARLLLEQVTSDQTDTTQ